MSFMASSAAAEQIVSDEGTPVFFAGVGDLGRHFSGYSFVAVDKRVTRHQGETETIRLRS
jgi:hypothetical protein